MPKTLYTILFMLTSIAVQAQDVSALLSEVMENVRLNRYQQIDERPLYDTARANEVLDALAPFLSDSVASVRSKGYRIVKRVGLRVTDQAIRERVVNQLLDGCQDGSSGVVGISASALTSFRKADFNQSALEKVRRLLGNKTTHFDRIIKLAGYLEMTDQINTINGLLATDTLLDGQTRWAAHLALARMGVPEEIGWVVGRVSSRPLNDGVVYELLPDLVYIRQAQAVDYLFQVVNSDEQLCESANPESDEKIACGYRVMEYLAGMLEGFPYQVDDSGDLITEDYRQALLDVRSWYQTNRSYVIRKDTY
ncbi:MAG: hypothetical protein AAFX87_00865 [Bacteroidota bacterium]